MLEYMYLVLASTWYKYDTIMLLYAHRYDIQVLEYQLQLYRAFPIRQTASGDKYNSGSRSEAEDHTFLTSFNKKI
jgi:hypothetical protein